ncbi:MAG: SPOR domain-containing protein [Acidimicrobiia bacterium]|nr:SPOR domain-containing protein [Acidimicrobiia bacterium]
MSILGDDAAAAVFDDRADADEAWGMLADAGVPATVVTDPGMLGAYRVMVVVSRDDLDRAIEILAPFIAGRDS